MASPSDTPTPSETEELASTLDSASVRATSAAIATGIAATTETDAAQVAAQVPTLTDIPTDVLTEDVPTEDAPTEDAPTAEVTETAEPVKTAEATEETGDIILPGTASVVTTDAPEVPSSTPPAGVPDTGDAVGDAGRFPTEAVVGGAALLLILGYVALYLRGLSTVNRYANGFVIDQCPVCRRGELIVDTNPKRTFGIPGARRTIRCTNCRSVLREIGDHRWRYAVDRMENIPLYDRLNNREVDEETLRLLLENPVGGSTSAAQLDFIDERDDRPDQTPSS